MVKCAYDGCENEFEPNSNRGQKYCSYECSKRANNARTMERYHRRKELLQSPRRKCATVGCATILRKTNMGEYCDPCLRQREENKKKSFRDMVFKYETDGN